MLNTKAWVPEAGCSGWERGRHVRPSVLLHCSPLPQPVFCRDAPEGLAGAGSSPFGSWSPVPLCLKPPKSLGMGNPLERGGGEQAASGQGRSSTSTVLLLLPGLHGWDKAFLPLQQANLIYMSMVPPEYLFIGVKTFA